MMEIFDCEQGSDEWFAIRMGIPTASEFHTVMARGRDGGASKTRRAYMHKLAGEIITGEPSENYVSREMERGKAMEDEARRLYAFAHDVEVTRVGFVRNGNKGCSPDSLIGADGMVEIKTNAPHVLIENILRGEVPPEHVAQCQGNLWVAERDWIDAACYWPKMPLFTKRAFRDEAYIKKLAEAVDAFNAELVEVVAAIRRYGNPPETLAERVLAAG